MATRKHTLESGEIDAAEDARVAKRRVKRLAKKKLRKVYPVKLCEGFEVFVTYKGGYALACVLAVEKQDAGFDQITVQVLHNGQEVTRTVGEKAAEVWRSAPAHLADKGRASRKELRLEKTVPFSHVPLQGAAALDTGMRAADAEEMLLRSEKVTGVIRATLTPAPKQRAPVRVCSALEDPKKRLTFLDTHCGSNKLATEIMLYSRNGWRVLSNDLDPTTNADMHVRFCDIDLPHLAEKYTLAHVHMAPACDTVCASANGNYGRHEGAEGLHNGKADLAADSPGLEVKLAIANADFGAMESNICELLYEHTNRTFSIEMPKQSHFH